MESNRFEHRIRGVNSPLSPLHDVTNPGRVRSVSVYILLRQDAVVGRGMSIHATTVSVRFEIVKNVNTPVEQEC